MQLAGKHNALALSLLNRSKPEPDVAAEAVQNALAVLNGRPTRGVIQRAGEMRRQMDTRWPNLPAVRELGDQVQHSRLALEAGQSANRTV